MKATAREVALLAVAIGLASGLLEALIRSVEVATGVLTGVGPGFTWMVPLAHLIAALLVSLPLILVASRRGVSFTAAVGAPAFIAWFGLASALGRIHVAALAFLAAGLAAQTGRVAARRATAMRRAALPAAAVMTLLAGAHAAAWSAWRIFAERAALTAIPAAPVGAPNVLLLIWDTVRAPSLALYGDAWPVASPLRDFAARGVTFDRAVAPASYTLPSHASIFTGHWPHELSVTWRSGLDRTYPTLAEALASAGWVTGGFSANFTYVTREFGLARGFAHFDEQSANLREIVRSTTFLRRLANLPLTRRALGVDDVLGRRSASEVGARLLHWLDGGRQGHPFFAFVNYYDAHTPYLPRAPFDSLFGWPPGGGAERARARHRALIEVRQGLPTPEARARLAAYRAAIAGLDADFGALLAALEQRGLLRNTIVIVTSDHGEEFGEHDLFGHGNSVYFASLHVPLVMAWPGHIPSHRLVADAVSLRDLAATVLDLAAVPGGARFPGASLAPSWADSAPRLQGPILAEVDQDATAPRAAPVSRGALVSLVAGQRWQLVRAGTEPPEVYDLDADPLGRARVTPASRERRLGDSLLAVLHAARGGRPR